MSTMAFSTDGEVAGAGGMFISTDAPTPTDPKLAALSAKLSGGGGGDGGGSVDVHEAQPPAAAPAPSLVTMSTGEVEDLLEDLD